MIIGNKKEIVADSENLRIAMEWINSTDLKTIPVGVYEVKGKDVFAQVQAYTPKKYEEGKFETHRLYADVQMVVEGEELMYASTDASLASTGEGYKEDIEFYAGEPKTVSKVYMAPDVVCVLYPEDYHKPSIRRDENPSPVKKIVVKVRV